MTSANWTGTATHAASWYTLLEAVPNRFLRVVDQDPAGVSEPGKRITSVVGHYKSFNRAYRSGGGAATEPPVLPERDGNLLGHPKGEWSNMDSGTASGQKVAMAGDLSQGT